MRSISTLIKMLSLSSSPSNSILFPSGVRKFCYVLILSFSAPKSSLSPFFSGFFCNTSLIEDMRSSYPSGFEGFSSLNLFSYLGRSGFSLLSLFDLEIRLEWLEYWLLVCAIFELEFITLLGPKIRFFLLSKLMSLVFKLISLCLGSWVWETSLLSLGRDDLSLLSESSLLDEPEELLEEILRSPRESLESRWSRKSFLLSFDSGSDFVTWLFMNVWPNSCLTIFIVIGTRFWIRSAKKSFSRILFTDGRFLASLLSISAMRSRKSLL